jgi:hypothetical protein
MRAMNANVAMNLTSELSREFIAFACELGVLRFGEFKTKAGASAPTSSMPDCSTTAPPCRA